MKGTVGILLVALVACAAAKHLPEPNSPIAVKRIIVAPPEDEVAIPERSEVKIEVEEKEVEVEEKTEVEVEVKEEGEVGVEEEVEVEEEGEIKLEEEEEEKIILWPNGCPVNHEIHWMTADVFDCSRFYQCVWGHKVAMQCPEPLHFNTRLQVCDWPQTAGCELFPVPLPIIPLQRVVPKNA